MQESIREIIHFVGPDTSEKVPAPVTLPALRRQGLIIVGLSNAGQGYCMHRPEPEYGHVLVGLGGLGRVWVEGMWAECGEGAVYISPPGAPSAFETLPGRRWQFAWVFTQTPADALSAAVPYSYTSSALLRAAAGPLAAAIDGIYQESIAPADHLLLEDWARLIRAYTGKITRMNSSQAIDPLARLWAEVDSRPAADWCLARLSGLAHMSSESVRKLSLIHHGRSPMEQVTYLRMRRADTLLRSTSMKLEVIARLVGYNSAFAFSTAFRRWCGVSPRARRQTEKESE